MTFTYPEELIDQLTEVWPKRDHEDNLSPQLPPLDQFREFLEVAYHASMLTEEQRKIGFRLAFISPLVAEQLAGPKELGRLFEPMTFLEPRDFSVPEILRLAPATDLTKVLICVSPLSEDGEASSGKLKIWGLIDTGSSWWEFSRGESSSGFPPPDCLTVSSIEPGNLTFSRLGFVLMSLKRGELITPSRETLYKGPIEAFLKDAENTIYDEACKVIGQPEFGRNERDREIPKQMYLAFLERLLFQIREKLHGGALIVISEALARDKDRLSDLVMIKYPCNYDTIWPFLVKSMAFRHEHSRLHFELYTETSGIPVEKHRKFSAVLSQREDVDQRISDMVNLIASTSGVDGAIIITDRFRLIGFGAEIIVASPDLREVHLARDHMAEDTSPVLIESYGTRHRSAFRFCWEAEDCVAFVVSQDGGVKGVKRVGDKLIFWPDINFGPMGI